MLRVRALLVCACLAVAASGCATRETPTPPPAAPPTPIGRLNTSSLNIPRIDFCTLLPRSAVKAAVGSKDWKLAAYGNGDKAPVTPTHADIAAEHLCVWQASAGTAAQTEARAWLFARPVDPRLARTVVRGEKRRGCTTPIAASFGSPTVTQECAIDGGTRVRHEGLFGDTWLGCEVTGAAGQMHQTRRRADAWCVEVANALNTNS